MNGIHKLSSVCLAIFSSIILVGCTLTMDEWVETEETKGYDDVETVENDFYKFSYQYKENTRSLTTDIQKYIAQVEADSIIWFTDNIPQGWLPQVGGGVVANCCQNFPMGLLAKVETIDHLSGMYRVQTTSAKIEELYDEFDLDLNTDVYTAPVEDADEEESGEEGSEAKATRATTGSNAQQACSSDSTQNMIIDWTLARDIERGKKQSCATRADLEDVWDEDQNATDEETADLQVLDATSILTPLLKSHTGGWVNCAELKILYTSKIKVRKIVQLKSKREYTKTTTSGGWKFNFKIGHDLSGKNADEWKDLKKQKDLLKQILKEHKEKKLKDYAGSLNKKDDPLDVELSRGFPITGTPLAIIVRLKPVVDFNVGLYGEGETTIWTSSEEVETEVINGKKIKDNKKNIAPPANSSTMSVYGNLSAKGGVEFFVGVGQKLGVKATDKAVGIGAFCEVTLNWDLNLGGQIDINNNISASAKDAISITGKGRFGGKILTGGLFGDVTLIAKDFTWWDGVTLPFNPKIGWGSDESSVDKGNYMEHHLAWYFSSTGIVWSNTWSMYNKPVLGVFEKGAIDTSNPVAVIRSTSISQKVSKNVRLEKNMKYYFTFMNTEKKDYDIIPGVTMSSSDNPDNITWYPDFKRTMNAIHRPSIEYYISESVDDDYVPTGYYDYVYQTLGKESSDGWWTYSYSIPFTLRDAAYIDEYWDDWGVHFEVHGEAVKSSYDNRMIPAWNKTSGWKSLKAKFYKSGSYKVTTSFSVNNSEQPIWCDAVIWYKPKGSSQTFKIRSEEAWPFSYQRYNYNKSYAGDISLKIKNYLVPGEETIYQIPGFTEEPVQLSSY